MKRISLICFAIGITMVSCNNNSKKASELTQAEKDSISLATTGRTFDAQVKHLTDSIINKVHTTALLDTNGLSTSPIKILKAVPTAVEYSNRKNVFLRYKNISKKKVAGIKFRWYGLNTFGEPADLGDYSNRGFGGGFTDDVIGAGRSDSGTWDIYSKDVKKIVIAWPYEVVFTDGTKWFINKNYSR